MTAPQFNSKTRRGIPHLLKFLAELSDYPLDDLGTKKIMGHMMYRRLPTLAERRELQQLVRWLSAKAPQPAAAELEVRDE